MKELRILFVTDHSPFIYQTGGHQRTNLICTALSKIAKVDVLSTEQEQLLSINNCSMIQLPPCPPPKRYFAQLLFLLVPPLFVKITDKLSRFFTAFTPNVLGIKNSFYVGIAKKTLAANNYDLIFIRYIKSMREFGIKPSNKIFIDIDDLPEFFFASKKNLVNTKNIAKRIYQKIFNGICVRTSRYYTRKIVENVAAAYLPNVNQCSLFKNAVYLPNIPFPAEFAEFSRNKSQYQIMFVGSIDYKPNSDGLEYFLDNIYPIVINKFPDVNFNIIGKISDERKKNWSNTYKNISILGMVENLNLEYQNCSLVIAPIYQGSGTNIKVIEAMKQSKACIITSFAAKGFEKLLKDGENILIASDNHDFANKIINVLEDKNLRESLGKTAGEDIDNSLYSFSFFSETIIKSIIL